MSKQWKFVLFVPMLACMAAGQQASLPTVNWSTASPESQSLDANWLRQADTYVQTQCPSRRSLLVIRNGYLVFEKYYRGSSATEAGNIQSISKSMLSALTGIAIEEGALKGTTQKLAEFYPEYFHPGMDPRKYDISLGHLLTMTAGFQWGEDTEIASQCFNSSDWNRFVIESPLAAPPGEVFNFSTGLGHLLSGILTKSSRLTLLAYAHSRLFLPLGMRIERWDKDPKGYYFGGSGLYMSPRDIAKFGLLVLRKGNWAGRQIVPESWLAESTRIRERTNNVTGDYGYQWWQRSSLGFRTLVAGGPGGQYMFVVPDLDLIVVTTATPGNDPDQTALTQQAMDILTNYVLPAAVQNPPEIAPDGIVNAADYSPRLAPGTLATLTGKDLASVTTTWDAGTGVDGGLPNGAGGVRVRISGFWAPVSLASPTSLSFLVPADLPAGRHTVEVMNAKGVATQEVTISDYAPAWVSVPKTAHAGQQVDLYAAGLGRTDPPQRDFRMVAEALPVPAPPVVTIGSRDAPVTAATLVSPGLYRVSVAIPADLPPGEYGVSLAIAGVQAPYLAVLQIAQ